MEVLGVEEDEEVEWARGGGGDDAAEEIVVEADDAGGGLGLEIGEIREESV